MLSILVIYTSKIRLLYKFYHAFKFFSISIHTETFKEACLSMSVVPNIFDNHAYTEIVGDVTVFILESFVDDVRSVSLFWWQGFYALR